jgi:hypothetical protein
MNELTKVKKETRRLPSDARTIGLGFDQQPRQTPVNRFACQFWQLDD